MKRIFFFYIIIALVLPAMLVAEDRPKVEAVIDWSENKVSLRAAWNLTGHRLQKNNATLRTELRSAILRKLSQVTATLWARASAIDEAGEVIALPDLAQYWENQKLTTFQVAENQASATMQVMLRGSRSLLASLPLRAAGISWSDGANANISESAYERRANVGVYDASQMEPLLYTGLVIDARHLSFNPSLNTEIFSSSGRQIYGAEFLSRATVVKRGAAGFAASESGGELRQRVGKRPLRVSALELARQGENALVISDEDAAKLLAHEGSLKNLKRARVVVLIAAPRIIENYN